ncbi:VOC family protein [Desertimonas flava]|uniref:VOC family protein n=1 Tax=Desertimonas flava TaxID=2064846 RepID=UPI000E349DFC|nr:VOC family protein [Desertimonas flava]
MDDPEILTPAAFHAAPGVSEWRVLFTGAHAHWRTTSLEQGAALVAAIAGTVAELDRAPDVDLRPRGVVVRTSRPDHRLDATDVAVAQRVSAAASALGLEPDPSVLQVIQLAVAQGPGVDVRPFWNAALGYVDHGPEDSGDPHRRGPWLWFHDIEPAVNGRGRTHIDVSVPADVAAVRVQAALAAGGRLVDDSHAPRWWTLASPDNHGVDIAAWPDLG